MTWTGAGCDGISSRARVFAGMIVTWTRKKLALGMCTPGWPTCAMRQQRPEKEFQAIGRMGSRCHGNARGYGLSHRYFIGRCTMHLFFNYTHRFTVSPRHLSAVPFLLRGAGDGMGMGRGAERRGERSLLFFFFRRATILSSPVLSYPL